MIPSAEIPAQTRIVTPQSKLSARAATPYVAIAAPIYVQELSIPEKVETRPLFANLFGTIVMSIRFIPCIPATISERRSADTIGLLRYSFAK